MSRISDIVQQIRTAVYGRDVRTSIADGIEICYSNVQEGKTIAETAAEQAVNTANTAATQAESRTTTAVNNANTAANNANTKAGLANTAATNANAAAQEARDAAANIESEIDDIYTELGYTTASMVAPTITGKFIKPDTGVITNISTSQKVSEFTPIPDGATSFLFKGNIVNNPYILLIAFYTTNNATGFISGVKPLGQDIIATVPENAKYYVVSDNADTSGGLHQITEKKIYIADYIDGRLSIYSKAVFTEGIEMNFINGQYIKSDTGQLIPIPSYSSFKCTDFIPLNGYDSVVINESTNIYNNSVVALVAFYESNNYSTFISSVPALGQSGFSVDVPANAKYVIYGSNTNAMGTYAPYNKAPYMLCVRSRNGIYNQEEHSTVLRCPSAYHLVTGDTFELFYKGIIGSWNDEAYLVKAQCDIGSNYKKRYVVTPSSSGSKSLVLTLYDSDSVVKDKKTITLNIHGAPTSPSSNKNILCVGDSLTYQGKWVKEMARRLTGSGGTPSGYGLRNISFIGTCEADDVNYEGYGGWTFSNYNTSNVLNTVKWVTCSHDKSESVDQHSIYRDGAGGQWKIESIETSRIKIIMVSGTASSFPSTGTLTWVSGGVNHSNIVYTASENAPGNPFWDSSQNAVNFATYASRIGASSIDYVFVLLGWNSAGSSKETYKSNAQTFINNVKASYPNAKIVLMGLEIPARDGLGSNYGATGSWSRYIDLLNFVHDLDDWYDELVGSNTNVYHINISGQFDTEHNMQQSTRAVNVRNSETETYQSNGVHPADSGYYQIADAATRCFVGLL